MQRLAAFISFFIFINPITAQQFSYKKSSEGIEISENNKPVLFYQTKPKSVGGKYEKSGYVHPLYDLAGNVLTEDMPEDHPFHRGIFWAWHQIIVDGKNIADGWTSEKIAFVPGKMQVTKSNKNIILSSQMVWQTSDSNKAPLNIVNEITRINIFNAKENYRVIDFNILLKPLVDLKLGGSDDAKGYGGFCVRLKLPEKVQFISGTNNIEPKDTAVLAGPWMDFKLNDAGIVVFGYTNESSTGHPWILRKSKSMQNVPYPGRVPVTIPAVGLKLDYRIIIHNDKLTSEEIEQLYAEYLK